MNYLRTALLVWVAGFAGCAVSPMNPDITDPAQVTVRVRTRASTLSKQQATLETTWDSLVVRMVAHDMDTIRQAFPLTPTGIASQTLEKVPAGSERIIEAWTVNSDGLIIHDKARDTICLAPNQHATVNLILEPARGSIYIDLFEIPTSVESVYAAFFVAGGATYSTVVPRSSKTFAGIDNIPYGQTGTLYIAGITDAGDTIGGAWRRDNLVFAAKNTTIEASFVNVGTVGLDVTINSSQVTLVRGILDSTVSLPDEQRSSENLLVISEIMFTAGSGADASCDYIEIHNPAAVPVSLDSLIIDISGSRKYFTAVDIAAGEYYVVANRAAGVAGWIDSGWVDDTCSFDLYSTSNWVTLYRRDCGVDLPVDWVAYENDDNIQGWPKLSSSAKTSIVLDSLPADTEYNNYGTNWREAVSEIWCDGTRYTGTPGHAGR
ncbi:MAG: hypothetical protein GF401_18320 [Chitinivibrionales bacterium]|nr:hypothetical protein [Chitinivibrionales bacterium]